MQDRLDEDSSSSPQRRRSFPPLAPRNSSRPSSASRDRTSGLTGPGRPPRLSRRSRAGCWTCRGRKVKCDEIHPRCGPCMRLNRDCDWDHRWSFSDATSSTLEKYSNVSTSGNIVWDPTALRSTTRLSLFQEPDDLPEFAALVNDDDRERKAGTRQPGTFGVVVTPDSFLDLPEYAGAIPEPARRRRGRRSSLPAPRGSFGRTSMTLDRSYADIDPDVVILERFEDVPSLPSAPPTVVSPSSRRDSHAEILQHRSESTPPGLISYLPTPLTPDRRANDPLVAHFRQYIVPRLVQPQPSTALDTFSQASIKYAFEAEAIRFAPLYHAMCAVSALNLAYAGRSTLEKAMQHYHLALAAQTHATTPTDLLSDGVFFRHFLLYIYDICIPMRVDDGGADMRAEHLNHLRRIAIARHVNRGSELYAYTLWTICELDMYACLLGSGNCEFFRTVLRQNMLPKLEQQIPGLTLNPMSGSATYLPSEAHFFLPVLNLNQGIVIHTAQLAQTAQACRMEADASRGAISADAYARWQASATQIQSELHAFWAQSYPDFLGPESAQTGHPFPERVCYVFENALLLYYAAIIYARTSLFPGQRRIPVANQVDRAADTERRVDVILALAAHHVSQSHHSSNSSIPERRPVQIPPAATTTRRTARPETRHAIFPVFIAGVATADPAARTRALALLHAFEGQGIGQNTARTRQLLDAVYADQRRRARAGGRVEDTDWLRVAADTGLGVVNCAL